MSSSEENEGDRPTPPQQLPFKQRGRLGGRSPGRPPRTPGQMEDGDQTTPPPFQESGRPRGRPQKTPRDFRGNRYKKVPASSTSSASLSTPDEPTPAAPEPTPEPMPAAPEPTSAAPETIPSASTSREDLSDAPSGYRVVDLQLFLELAKSIPCRNEDCTRTAYTVEEKRRGFMMTLTLWCKVCASAFTFNDSHHDNLITRFILSMFDFGFHYEKGKEFLVSMDMPTPVSAVTAAACRKKIATEASRKRKRYGMGESESSYEAGAY